MSLQLQPRFDHGRLFGERWQCASRCLARLETVDNKEAIESSLAEVCDGLGLGYYSYVCSVPGQYAHLSPQSPMLLTNYPDEWQQRYRSRAYHTFDPVVLRGSRRRRPFFWGDADYVLGLPHASQRLWGEGRQYGIETGVTVPVHGPMGEWGLFTVAGALAVGDLQRQIADVAMTLELLATRVHVAAVERILGVTVEASASLTDNERVCLAWTLQGKTAWEISRIMGRSKSTVDYHVQMATRKLGAANKVHAAFKALQSGLL